MVNSWIQATKLYNDKNNSSGVPKKGTEAYETVKRIQDELKKRALAEKPIEDPPAIKPVAEKPVIKPQKDPKPKKLQEIVEEPPKQTKVSKKNAFKTI